MAVASAPGSALAIALSSAPEDLFALAISAATTGARVLSSRLSSFSICTGRSRVMAADTAVRSCSNVRAPPLHAPRAPRESPPVAPRRIRRCHCRSLAKSRQARLEVSRRRRRRAVSERRRPAGRRGTTPAGDLAAEAAPAWGAPQAFAARLRGRGLLGGLLRGGLDALGAGRHAHELHRRQQLGRRILPRRRRRGRRGRPGRD